MCWGSKTGELWPRKQSDGMESTTKKKLKGKTEKVLEGPELGTEGPELDGTYYGKTKNINDCFLQFGERWEKERAGRHWRCWNSSSINVVTSSTETGHDERHRRDTNYWGRFTQLAFERLIENFHRNGHGSTPRENEFSNSDGREILNWSSDGRCFGAAKGRFKRL